MACLGRACVVPEAERGAVLPGDAHVERLRGTGLTQLAGDAARNLRRLQEAGARARGYEGIHRERWGEVASLPFAFNSFLLCENKARCLIGI